MHNQLFIIGAQRSGSTFLYHLLDSHPNIHMIKPVFPESKLFINSPELTELDFNTLIGEISSEIQIIGEKSTSYYENIESLHAIHRFNPKSKILFIMRDPVERSLSNYFYSLKNGIETRTLEEAFIHQSPPPPIAKRISVDPFNYLGRSEYDKHVLNILNTFGEKNVLFLQLENFLDPERLKVQLIRVEDFLNISAFKEVKATDKKVNEAKRTKVVSTEVYSYLYNYFKSFNQNLSKTIHIDLSLWQN